MSEHGERLLRSIHNYDGHAMMHPPKVPYLMSAPTLVRIGPIGFVHLTVCCRWEHIAKITTEARHQAFMLLAERGICSSHLRFKTTVSDMSDSDDDPEAEEPQAAATVERVVRLRMSDMLTSAVLWEPDGTGTLPAIWQL